jgi:hypothetical protein
MNARLGKRLGLLAVLFGCAAVSGAGCGGSENASVPTPNPDGAADGTTSGEDSSAGGDGAVPGDGAITDAEVAVDGEVITDGGSNIDLDGGEEDDAGPDAAACNTIQNQAAAVISTCASVAPILGGGALVAGTYHLVSVTALGTQNFCNNKFVPVGFKQTVELTVATDGVGTAQSVGQIGQSVPRHRTSTLAPGANNTSPLTATQVCPTQTAAGQFAYASGPRNNKQAIALYDRYGQGLALYIYVKQ